MKLKPGTLQLLAGVAALSAVTAADKPEPKVQKVEPPKDARSRQVDVRAVFAVADLDKDGVVTFEEFKKSYLQVEQRMQQERLKLVLGDCPWCGQG